MVKVEVSLFDIVDYVGDRKRPLREGEALFKAGHVILCEALSQQEIFSLVLQTSALSSTPHEVNIRIGSGNVKDWHCTCTCKAGTSGCCKHIVGTLIYANKQENLDPFSATDAAQAWGKEKKELANNYSNFKVTDFCHPKKKVKLGKVSCSRRVKELNFQTLVNCKTESALFKFKNRTISEERKTILSRCNDEQTSHLGSKYYDQIFANARQSTFLPGLNLLLYTDNLNFCCKEVLEKLKESDISLIAKGNAQRSDIWKKERQLRITGSRCYSIFTYSKSQWDIKAFNYFWPKDFSGKYTSHGIKFENEAFKCYQSKKTDYEVVNTSLIVCEMYPWLAVSPDGIIFQNGVPSKLLEIKCPWAGKKGLSSQFKENCDYLTIENGKLRLKTNHQYNGQIQMSMALLNLPACDLILYSEFSKDYLEVLVPFDEVFAENLLRRVTSNYFHHMIHVYCQNKHIMQDN